MKTIVCVTVQNGTVQHVATNNPDIEFLLLDYDNDNPADDIDNQYFEIQIVPKLNRKLAKKWARERRV